MKAHGEQRRAEWVPLLTANLRRDDRAPVQQVRWGTVTPLCPPGQSGEVVAQLTQDRAPIDRIRDILAAPPPDGGKGRRDVR